MCCYAFDLSHVKRMLEIFAFCKEVFGLKLIENKSFIIPLGTLYMNASTY
jgi:hypothetical protein